LVTERGLVEESFKSVKKRRSGRKASRYSHLAAPSRLAQGWRTPAHWKIGGSPAISA